MSPQMTSPRIYRVSAARREPLLAFMLDSLRTAACRIISASPPDEAPFRITLEAPGGERIGIVAYAFLITRTPTKNRPADEVTFQIKYGSKEVDADGDPVLHEIWQDPAGLHVTLLIGIDPANGYFVGIDPVLHSPTKFFIRVEFKDENVEEILRRGWHTWERKRLSSDEPIEALVGGTSAQLLRYVRFEREALGEDQGPRQLLAEQSPSRLALPNTLSDVVAPRGLHALAREFELSESEVLDVISNARRLKMAVRGWVAEEHLVRHLRLVPGVTDCERVDDEGAPDVQLRFRGSRLLSVECKNTLRQVNADQLPRIDFQRTRASKNDPCSRFYRTDEFDVLAGCLHARTERWEFSFVLPRELEPLPPKKGCPGRLSNNVKVDARWSNAAADVLGRAAR